MKVVINGEYSEVYSINAGVPQGSVLSPTLNLIFIIDLPDNLLKSLLDIYADDSTIYSVSSKEYHLALMTTDLTSDLLSVVERG